jgi:D-tagatose-1,6-bisphosphate aldolase subunit GatZ/KbaZ
MSRAPAGVQRLRDLLAANRRGERAGVTSICSAEPFVLEAAAMRAARGGGLLCIESTANQVNQDGGYTGLTPAAFRDAVAMVTAAAGVPAAGLVLGGDHLGPYPWRAQTATSAMAAARELVRCCVLAGYTKLHLDASMACADDPGGSGGPLDDATATTRALDLCRAAEAAHGELPDGAPAPVYVIGTEVPAPGGEVSGDAGPRVTPVAAVERTLRLARDGFAAGGLENAWERVVAVVVQPGVEFGDETVAGYDPAAAEGLSDYLRREWPLVYEAHSTDYQTPAALARLVDDRFAILKVGPWLTFAFREAVFALEDIEAEALRQRPNVRLSHLRDVLDAAMVRHPEHWAAYYHGSAGEVRFKRAFSYSDRCRYYWPQQEVQEALATLLRNLAERPIPATLLSQYLPCGLRAVEEGQILPEPAALIRHHVQRVLDLYVAACGDEPGECEGADEQGDAAGAAGPTRTSPRDTGSTRMPSRG